MEKYFFISRQVCFCFVRRVRRHIRQSRLSNSTIHSQNAHQNETVIIELWMQQFIQGPRPNDENGLPDTNGGREPVIKLFQQLYT
jgi:hypothetical protein